MRRRNQNKKTDYNYSQDEQLQDSLNQDYVNKKRQKKKKTGPRANKPKNGKKKNKQSDNQDSINQSQQVIQFKHNDEQVKQHYRPSFIQRWNGTDNQIQIFQSEYDDMSPMFKVYWQTKSKNMNAIIFVQIGSMEYFAFENDAIALHQIFKKKLKHYSAFLMVNFWCKQIILAKQQLFERNMPVLMMNEIQDPAYKRANGIIRRQIDQVLTPGIHIQLQDKAYKQRWFMIFYIADIKQITSKKIQRFSQQKKMQQNQEEQLKKACVILLDSQSNNFYIQQFEVDSKLYQIRRVINRYRPVQLLIKKSSISEYKMVKQIARQICNPYTVQIQFDKQNEPVNLTLDKFLSQSNAPIFKQLKSLAAKQKKLNHEFSMFATVKCLDLIYKYLSNLKLKNKIFDQGIFSLSCVNETKLKPFFDSQVYENLQVFRIKNQDQGQSKKGTLISYIDLCLTNSGKKLLRKWINQPLRTKQSIVQRQKCIQEIVQSHDYSSIIIFHQKLIAYEKLQKQITDIYHWVVKGYDRNFKKLTGNLNFQKGYDQKKNPAIIRIKQIVKILNMLLEFQQFLTELKKFNLKSKYFQKLVKVSNLSINAAKQIQSTNQLKQNPKIKQIIQSIKQKIDYDLTTDLLQPTKGVNQEYDQIKKRIVELQQKLNMQLEKWKKHFNNNKICFVHVRARNQIQIPKACLTSRKQRPKQLIFSSQVANSERFTTNKTIQISQELMIQQSRLAKQYQPFLHDIIEDFCQFKFIWNKCVQSISQFDVIFSIAQTSKRMIFKCLPQFLDDDNNSSLQIQQGTHPGLIQVCQPEQIISNNLIMSDSQRFLLLTGPNMGGKSTLLRQTCLLAILAQIGSYVPCNSYKSIVFDQIFCRIGASDRLIQGKSTFYVQLQETHRILRQATSSSLVIIDELGRGTSTYDGMAIAESTIKFILNKIGCYTLFSTHYTPVTKDFIQNDQVKCSKMSYKIIDKQKHEGSKKKNQNKLQDDRIQFLYQVEVGVAQKSFANNVARMVGLPEIILDQANIKAEWISKIHQQAQNKWQRTKNLNYLTELGIVKIKDRQAQNEI